MKITYYNHYYGKVITAVTDHIEFFSKEDSEKDWRTYVKFTVREFILTPSPADIFSDLWMLAVGAPEKPMVSQDVSYKDQTYLVYTKDIKKIED